MTAEGELVGLFLSEPIPAGLSAMETAQRIRSQGGLVYLEHPYDQVRRHLNEDSIDSISHLIDIVEVYNARSDARANAKAEQLCSTIGAVAGVGSDAHTLAELGSVYVEMDAFGGAADFLSKLRAGKIVVGRSRMRLIAEAKLKRWRESYSLGS